MSLGKMELRMKNNNLRTTMVVACACLFMTATAAPRAADPGDTAPPIVDPGHTAHRQALEDWVAGHRRPILDELTAFLRLPNTNADKAAIVANAEALRTMWEKRGATVRFLPGDGGPYVFAHLPAAENPEGGRPLTLLFYAHYDGQPVDETRWEMTAPFVEQLAVDKLPSDSPHWPGRILWMQLPPEGRIMAGASGDAEVVMTPDATYDPSAEWMRTKVRDNYDMARGLED